MKHTVIKSEAATRQLAIAVRLFFSGADILAVHTLAAAARQILHDRGKKQGFDNPFRSTEYVRADRQREWHAALARTENFLKHADKDPDAVLEYEPSATEFLLFEAVVLAEHLLDWQGPEKLAYTLWFVHEHPGVFKADYASAMQASSRAHGADASDRTLWHEWLLRRTS